MTRKTTDSRCEEGSSRTDFVGMLRGAGLLLAGCAAAVLLFSVTGCSATDADEPSIASTAEVLEENASEKSVEYASLKRLLLRLMPPPSILNIPSAIWMLPLMNRLRPR